MNPWLIAQIAFAAIAWFFATRWVIRIHSFKGSVGRPLASIVRALRRAGRSDEVRSLPNAIGADALEILLDVDEQTSADELVGYLRSAIIEVTPPIRVLRTLATTGTMFGLLCAVANLRGGINMGGHGMMDLAAGRAFDCAVMGFVTALPCWTAAVLCRQGIQASRTGLELVLLSMRADQEPSDTKTESDPKTKVDGASDSQ